MKKLFVLIMFFSITVFLYAENSYAEIISFVGKAEYQENSEWKALEQGLKLKQGTIISTGFKSSVVLKIGNSNFTIAPLTRITISKLIENDSNYDTEVKLATGKLKMDVKPVSAGKSSKFTVKSPVATASIRGTSGEFSAGGKLVAYTGIWTYNTSASKEIFVTANQEVVISEKGEIVLPQENAKKETKLQGSTERLSEQELVFHTPISPAISENNEITEAKINVSVIFQD